MDSAFGSMVRQGRLSSWSSNEEGPDEQGKLAVWLFFVFSGRLRYPKPQLGIEIDVVIPRQPIGGIQLIIRQGHHFRKAGWCTSRLINEPLRHHNILVAHDLDRTRVHTCKVDPRAR